MASRSIIVCVVGLLCGPMTAQSQPVPVGYQQVAREYGLPPALLYAVALTESGQSCAQSKEQFRPWPWALNIDGEGALFFVPPAARGMPCRRRWRKPMRPWMSG
jgi:hypothetical protein